MKMVKNMGKVSKISFHFSCKSAGEVWNETWVKHGEKHNNWSSHPCCLPLFLFGPQMRFEDGFHSTTEVGWLLN